jgi:hypothetical protein
MWERTKRLVNSYLDELIERLSRPDREGREIVCSEKARLNELEAQARASAKMLEKALAEIELKLASLPERDHTAQEVSELTARRDLLKRQLAEANASAERARAIRDQSRAGPELTTEAFLASMRETLASVQTAFNPTDPAATIEEMRARIRQAPSENNSSRAGETLDQYKKSSQVDEILDQYKESLSESGKQQGEYRPTEPEQPKTLGPAQAPIHPID